MLLTSEFERRLNGESYADIAKSGGGIVSSIKSTREESFDDIYESSAKRLKALIREGVTTVEIKTGYGLDFESELKMIQIADKLEENYPVHVEKTFLGAHAVPPEYKDRADDYIEYVCEEMMPKVALHVSAVDIYTEHLAFNLEQTEKVFEKAKDLGLHVKIHAEQFSQMGATKLACKYKALSSDHLEYIDEESVKEMAKSGTVAVLLPGAYYFLRETKMPPMELFRKHGVAMAIATDLNPGTSALCSLQLMMNMSSVIFGFTVDEAFGAVTINAAKALGLEKSKGSLEEGKDADFVIWDVEHPRDLICSFRPTSVFLSVQNGEVVDI
ncbi:MAG TPA: imidazolonepropionase [Sulfurospirillum arcachonense]|nr:imidazolonepropionase [Sulfurospirillum arcachonense]